MTIQVYRSLKDGETNWYIMYEEGNLFGQGVLCIYELVKNVNRAAIKDPDAEILVRKEDWEKHDRKLPSNNKDLDYLTDKEANNFEKRYEDYEHRHDDVYESLFYKEE